MAPATVTVEERLGARCLACGYSLHALPAPRCPECGRPFDPTDPWTMRLPERPNAVVRWLAGTPDASTRWLPALAVAALAWGTSVPGWLHPLTLTALLVLGGCCAALAARAAAVRVLHARGYPATAALADVRQGWRRLGVAAAVAAAVLVVRPTMYARFWASRPWFDRTARAILAKPFADTTPYVGAPRGLYGIRSTRRCPHGVKLFVGDATGWSRDGGPGFFYRAVSGDCVRFDLGRPLGGGWYASD